MATGSTSLPEGSWRGALPHWQRWAPALVLLFGLGAHLPSLWSGLIWDDKIVLRNQLPHFETLRDVVLPPASIPNWSDNYFRPLVTLSYLVDFRWLGDTDSVLRAHVSNLALHLTTTWLVWLLMRRLLGPRQAGPVLIAASVFAVHPVHVESVNWISGRSDVLATLFVVAAALSALRWRDQQSVASLGSMSVCILLALFAKETAITALLLIPLVWLLVPGSGHVDAKSWLAGAVALALPAFAYLATRTMARVGLGTALDLSPLVTAIGLTRALSWYLLRIVIPWPQHVLVTWDLLPGLIVAGVITAAATGFVILAARLWRRSGDGTPLLALAWFFVALIPSLWVAISFGTRAPVAERYLYLPSVGIALGAGWLLAAVPAAWLSRVAATAVALYAAGAFGWGLTWSSELSLWTQATAKSPGNVFAWHGLARAWREAGSIERARVAYERGLDGEPEPFERSKLLYGLAELSLAERDFDQAMTLMRRSMLEDPDFLRARYGLALVGLLRAGEAPGTAASATRAAAARDLEVVVRQMPDFHEARMALAQVMAAEAVALGAVGRTGAALSESKAALAILDEMEARLSAERLAAHLREAEPGLERDPGALRRRIRQRCGC